MCRRLGRHRVLHASLSVPLHPRRIIHSSINGLGFCLPGQYSTWWWWKRWRHSVVDPAVPFCVLVRFPLLCFFFFCLAKLENDTICLQEALSVTNKSMNERKPEIITFSLWRFLLSPHLFFLSLSLSTLCHPPDPHTHHTITLSRRLCPFEAHIAA